MPLTLRRIHVTSLLPIGPDFTARGPLGASSVSRTVTGGAPREVVPSKTAVLDTVDLDRKVAGICRDMEHGIQPQRDQATFNWIVSPGSPLDDASLAAVTQPNVGRIATQPTMKGVYCSRPQQPISTYLPEFADRARTWACRRSFVSRGKGCPPLQVHNIPDGCGGGSAIVVCSDPGTHPAGCCTAAAAATRVRVVILQRRLVMAYPVGTRATLRS